ncbi:hypothetical protein SVAN01_11012 [Stagonosporopsis vannaccii]|nr:hypothetical protein SVAN01_11012 [Stagonosporopsis vannaccii]
MAIPRDPTPAEIAHFLITRSGDQMLQLVQSLRAPVAQAALTKTMLWFPPKATVKVSPPEKARKALNAFVGFRCYYIYIPALKPWPMKKISNLMGIMWEADPNKSMWSLLAKAWSTIRDQIGKDKAPLDQFLRLLSSHLNLPSPELYLDYCGWELKVNAEGNPILLKGTSQSLNATSAGIAGMALSVEDIMKYCQVMGYATEFTPGPETHSPTFLAQSRNDKSATAKSQTHFASSAHEARIELRDKRRAKKQNVRANATAQALQQQITYAHNMTEPDVHDQDAAFFGLSESMEFYDELAGILTDHLGRNQQGIADTSSNFAGASSDLVASGGPIPTDWTDSGAFRLGADEEATLPSFDPAYL